MALCKQCADDVLVKYGDSMQAPVPCKECDAFPAYWWGPQFG